MFTYLILSFILFLSLVSPLHFQDIIGQARAVLAARRDAQQRLEALAEMREVAASLLGVLGELEGELKAAVDAVPSDLGARTALALMRAEGFLHDDRDRDDGDIQRVARRAAQVSGREQG